MPPRSPPTTFGLIVDLVRLLLISGRPGAGKSTFCHWLEGNRGYTHVEADRDRGKWLALVGDPNPQKLITKLRTLGTDVAFEVGYAPDLLPGIERLSAEGVEIWWFDGDPEAAWQNFQNRDGPVSQNDFHAQVALIDAGRLHIDRTYQGRILQVVGPGPTSLAPEKMWELCQLDR